MSDRAHLIGETPRGFKWCVFPCQKHDANGDRLQRDCRVPVDPAYQGKVWQVSGPPDAPTLSPSIDCESKPCWHGFIVDGKVQP